MGASSGRVGVAVLRVALVVLLGVAVVGAALWLGQRRMIYFPDRAAVPAAETVIPGARDVVLDTRDGVRLGAWLVPPARRPRNVAVLVAPGNAGNRLGRAVLARALSGDGFAVLLMDYRGYGGNPGGPSQRGLARDVRAAREYLVGAAGYAPTRTIYFGESLGAAVVTELATEHPPAGLVLRSPFEDLAAVARYHYPMLPVRALLRDRYPVAGLVGGITAPTVVIYGAADSIVPPQQSRTVAARAGGPVRVVRIDGADHNDPALVDGPAVIAAVAQLADRLG
jgi:pimeloyl-ACP methyl ester carboxylesterase